MPFTVLTLRRNDSKVMKEKQIEIGRKRDREISLTQIPWGNSAR